MTLFVADTTNGTQGDADNLLGHARSNHLRHGVERNST